MKKHRLDNGDYPYENGHMNGELNTIQYGLFCWALSSELLSRIAADRIWFEPIFVEICDLLLGQNV